MFFNSLPTVISSCCSKCGSKNFSIPIAAEKMYESPKTKMWSYEKATSLVRMNSTHTAILTTSNAWAVNKPCSYPNPCSHALWKTLAEQCEKPFNQVHLWLYPSVSKVAVKLRSCAQH